MAGGCCGRGASADPGEAARIRGGRWTGERHSRLWRDAGPDSCGSDDARSTKRDEVAAPMSDRIERDAGADEVIVPVGERLVLEPKPVPEAKRGSAGAKGV